MSITECLKDPEGNEIKEVTYRKLLIQFLSSAHKLIDLQTDDFLTIFELQLKCAQQESPEFDTDQKTLFLKLFRSKESQLELWLLMQLFAFIGEEKTLKLKERYNA